LIIGQMSIEDIQRSPREHINVLYDKGNRKLMTHHVQVQSAVGKAGRVLDPDAGHRDRFLTGLSLDRRKQLPECLHSPESAGGAACLQLDPSGLDLQFVSFRWNGTISIDEQLNGIG